MSGKDFGSEENAGKMYGRFVEREAGSDTRLKTLEGCMAIVGPAEDMVSHKRLMEHLFKV